MKIPRTLAVFFCAAGAALTLTIIKALVVSGLDRLPPVKLLIFTASAFGLIAALLDGRCSEASGTLSRWQT